MLSSYVSGIRDVGTLVLRHNAMIKATYVRTYIELYIAVFSCGYMLIAIYVASDLSIPYHLHTDSSLL